MYLKLEGHEEILMSSSNMRNILVGIVKTKAP